MDHPSLTIDADADACSTCQCSTSPSSSSAKDSSKGDLVLRDLPTDEISIDGWHCKLLPGFRGFSNVSRGIHIIDFKCDGKNVRNTVTCHGARRTGYRWSADMRTFVPVDAEVDALLQDSKIVEGFCPFDMLRSRVSFHCKYALFDGHRDRQFKRQSSNDALVQVPHIPEGKTTYEDDELHLLVNVYECISELGLEREPINAYYRILLRNDVVDFVMAEHAEYFLRFGRLLLREIHDMPELLQFGMIREQMVRIAADLQNIDNADAAVIGQRIQREIAGADTRSLSPSAAMMEA
jgi:hypothetical protein